jgi:hypothetical protein
MLRLLNLLKKLLLKRPHLLLLKLPLKLLHLLHLMLRMKLLTRLLKLLLVILPESPSVLPRGLIRDMLMYYRMHTLLEAKLVILRLLLALE